MTNDDSEVPSSSTNSSRASTTLEITEKLRVLCLHGYRQDGDLFRSKIGSFRKFVDKYAEFVFLTAPHQAPPVEVGAAPQPHQRSWWANKDDGSFRGTHKSGPAIGFQESLEFVENAWRTQGPFHGLLGFSQGACFVGLLCHLANRNMTIVQPEFAVLASGFISGSLAHKGVYQKCVSIPTLHIVGTSDEIIPAEMSLDLVAHFKNEEVLEHDGGHYFPATKLQKATYVRFFQDCLQERLERLEIQRAGAALELTVSEHADHTTDDDVEDDGC